MLYQILLKGLLALKEYIALHVITCLVPAFLLAGAMVSFISKEAILKYLGSKTKKIISFPLSALSSILLAVCSCTVIPIAAGIYFQGGGVGPAFILLWVAPASNVLALIYTGAILGYDIAGIRLFLALLTATIVGWILSWSFRKEEQDRINKETQIISDETRIIEKRYLILIILILISLLAPNYLVQKGPYYLKVLVFSILFIISFLYVFKFLSGREIKDWLRESWWFVKIIFPLLLLGVFIVGIVGAILKRSWIESWLGGRGILPSFLATLIGALSYFATLTEAPFVHTLMKLGMGKGPAIALLLSGPGLSLPNMLALGRIFGWKKTTVYVITIVILSTLSGYITGKILT